MHLHAALRRDVQCPMSFLYIQLPHPFDPYWPKRCSKFRNDRQNFVDKSFLFTRKDISVGVSYIVRTVSFCPNSSIKFNTWKQYPSNHVYICSLYYLYARIQFQHQQLEDNSLLEACRQVNDSPNSPSKDHPCWTFCMQESETNHSTASALEFSNRSYLF